ncbi:MAG: sulfotransferase family protein [Planctomycetota bacterium]|jgi:hypothetical protein
MANTGEKTEIICILGPHRSGSSLITRMASLLGVSIGREEQLVPAAVDNPKGFWENKNIVEINDAILARLGGEWRNPPSFPDGWITRPDLADLREQAQELINENFGNAKLWGWKDPRTCLTLPFWQQLLPGMKYVVCVRNPAEAARSLEERNQIPFLKGIGLWFHYMVAIFRYTVDYPTIVISYEDLINNWKTQAKRLSEFLGFPERANDPEFEAQLLEFMDVSMKHYTVSLVETMDNPAVGLPSKAIYMVLLLAEALKDKGGDLPENLQDWQNSLTSFALTAREVQDGFEELHGKIETLSTDLESERSKRVEFENLSRKLHTEVADAKNNISELSDNLAKTNQELEKFKSVKKAELQKLSRWIEQIETQVEEVYKSKRWRLGNFIGNLWSAVLFKRKNTMPKDILTDLFASYHEWQSDQDDT